MRPHRIALSAALLALLLAVSPAGAQKGVEVASPAGDRDTYRASWLADLEDYSKTRGNAPPWARRAGAQHERAASDVQCSHVKGQFGEQVFLDPCMYQGHEYEWCVELPMFGTLNGTYRYFGGPETEYALAVPPGALGHSWMFGATAALVVFDTNRGEVFGEENLIFHYDEPWSFAEFVVFTGGTGHYEGATGWMGTLSSFEYPQGTSLVETGFYWGVICTPKE